MSVCVRGGGDNISTVFIFDSLLYLGRLFEGLISSLTRKLFPKGFGPSFEKGNIIQGSKHEVTKIIPLCKNGNNM